MRAGNYSVRRLMDDVRAGRIILPDFQRSFVWHPDDVKDLLVSIIGDYYVGSMLYMDEPRVDAPFALRLVEGVKEVNPDAEIDSIVKILLDGQQRTSSLFYALYAPPLPLAGRKSPFLYFLDLDALFAEDFENAVKFCITSNRRLVQRYSSDEALIAFTEFHDLGVLLAKLTQTSYANRAAQIITVVNRFLSYEVQTIELPRGTTLERVVETFERINRTGLPLAVSDLLVARLYVEGIRLRQMITDAQATYRFLKIADTDYVLRTMCLLRNHDVRRGDVLTLSSIDFERDWNDACWGLEQAFTRVVDIRDGYGAFDFGKFAPFKTILVPLAALLALLKREGIQTDANFTKINQWYWTTCFGNRFNEAVNTKTSSDYKTMRDWITDASRVPDYIRDFNVEHVDLSTDSKSNAVYKAVLCLSVKAGALDYLSGQPPQFVPNRVEDDHIFPKSRYFDDSCVNRTLVSSNQTKSNQDPGVFFASLENINGKSKMEAILSTHLINAEAYAALLRNDTRQFFQARARVIRDKIAELTPEARVSLQGDD